MQQNASATSSASLSRERLHWLWIRYRDVLSKQYWKKSIFWSDGYFAYSIGEVSSATIDKYIAEQGEERRKRLLPPAKASGFPTLNYFMNDSRSKMLLEYYTEIYKRITTNASIKDNAEPSWDCGCIFKEKSSKRTVSPLTIHTVTALAICFVLLITGVVFIPKLFSDRSYDTESNVINQHLICDSSDSERSGRIQERPVITGGALPDDTLLEAEGIGIPSRNSKYLSPLLEKKMIEHQGENVLYRVIVEILITREEYDEFEDNLMNDSYYRLVYSRWEAICAEYEKLYNELGSSLALVGEDSEQRMEIFNELDRKKKEAENLTINFLNLQNKYVKQFRKSIIEIRQKFAFSLSKSEPVTTSYASFSQLDYHGGSYILELTAGEIKDLSEMGGYCILLASDSDEILPWIHVD